MSKENRMKVVLSLLGISFPVVGGILSVYVEDCGVLLLIGGIAGMTFCLAWAFKVFCLVLLFATVLCPAIFFWVNPNAFKVGTSKEWEELRILIQREQTRVNWDVFITRYVENRACGIGMLTEDGINAIIAECRQREGRHREFERRLDNEANGGRTRDRKPWWLRTPQQLSVSIILVGILLYGSLKEIDEFLNRQEAKCKGVNDAEICC